MNNKHIVCEFLCIAIIILMTLHNNNYQPGRDVGGFVWINHKPAIELPLFIWSLINVTTVNTKYEERTELKRTLTVRYISYSFFLDFKRAHISACNLVKNFFNSVLTVQSRSNVSSGHICQSAHTIFLLFKPQNKYLLLQWFHSNVTLFFSVFEVKSKSDQMFLIWNYICSLVWLQELLWQNVWSSVEHLACPACPPPNI